MIGLLATSVLMLVGSAWVSRRWKLVVALGGITALAGAAHYFIANGVWLANGDMTMIHRYVGWFITMPLQVVMLYFYIRAFTQVPVGVFWRILVASILMVTARFMGEAGLMLPTLGFLLSLALWLYILGEAFFGRMSDGNLRYGSEAAQRGFFWLRLIMTIGWAIYPLAYFIASFTGTVQIRYLVTTYNLADFINVIAFDLTILSAGLREAESSRA